MYAVSETIVDALVGDVWEVRVSVPAGSAVTSTVTTPGGIETHPAVPVEGTEASLDVTVAEEGRYVVQLALAGVGSVAFVANVLDITIGGDLPSLPEVREYLNTNGDSSATDDAITEALYAETANQRRVCDIGGTYDYDLREALKRRVARNLAARSVPLATVTSFDGVATSVRVPRYDAEIDRLEGPYRKINVG